MARPGGDGDGDGGGDGDGDRRGDRDGDRHGTETETDAGTDAGDRDRDWDRDNRDRNGPRRDFLTTGVLRLAALLDELDADGAEERAGGLAADLDDDVVVNHLLHAVGGLERDV